MEEQERIQQWGIKWQLWDSRQERDIRQPWPPFGAKEIKQNFFQNTPPEQLALAYVSSQDQNKATAPTWSVKLSLWWRLLCFQFKVWQKKNLVYNHLWKNGLRTVTRVLLQRSTHQSFLAKEKLLTSPWPVLVFLLMNCSNPQCERALFSLIHENNCS